jgi:hypothetical protein
LALSPTTLWPPNHKLYAITAAIQASDICDANPQVTLLSAVSDEPDDATGDGLSFLFILGLALCFDHVRTSAYILRRLVTVWALASIVYNSTLMALYIAEVISREGPLF